MENSVHFELAGATVLSTLSNSRMNVLANRRTPPHLHNNENGTRRPTSDRIPPAEQVTDFFSRRERSIEDIMLALLSRTDDFVTAMLDTVETDTRQVGFVPWASEFTQMLVCDFGWVITEVLSRDDDGELEDVVIKRPSRLAEGRARARSNARRARGGEAPLPRTYYEHQVDYFLSHAGQDEVGYELRTAPAIVVECILEHLKKVAMSDSVPYWSSLTSKTSSTGLSWLEAPIPMRVISHGLGRSSWRPHRSLTGAGVPTGLRQQLEARRALGAITLRWKSQVLHRQTYTPTRAHTGIRKEREGKKKKEMLMMSRKKGSSRGLGLDRTSSDLHDS